MNRRVILATAVIAGLVWIAADLSAQIPVVDGSKFAGLKWTFVRIKYGTYDNEGSQTSRLQYWDEPWAIDAPAAEQNLSRLEGAMTRLVTLHAGKLKGGAAANMGLLGGHH